MESSRSNISYDMSEQDKKMIFITTIKIKKLDELKDKN